MGWSDIPLAQETEIPKVPHQDQVDNFFPLSRRSAQRIHTRGKIVNAEFYNGVIDRLLKCIQWVHPAAFCSRDFFLLHNNVPAHKAAIANFLPKKKKGYNSLSPPYSPDLSLPDSLLIPQLKMKLKGLHFADVAEIQESVTDELKKVPKRGIFGRFSESVRPHKSLYICQWSLFLMKKRYMSSSCVFDF
jgi:hypothetical protein